MSLMGSSTTTGRTPRGWASLIGHLAATTDLAEFHRGMLDLQCKIVAAEYGAMWTIGPGGSLTMVESWPASLAQGGPDEPMKQVLSRAAKSAAERGSSVVMRIDQQGIEATPGLGAHLFVTVMTASGKAVALTTVVADCRDPQVLQSTAPLREVAAGLYELCAVRHEAQARAAEADRVRRAMAVLATSQEAEGFGGATMNLVNELARQLHCSRVSLGWVRGRSVRLVAMSDTEHLARHSEPAALLELAMAECLDQQQPIVYPVPDDAEPILAYAVVHAHKRLAGAAGHGVVSVPLRLRDQWLGVLTLERADEPFSPGIVQHLQLIADVVTPHLSDRKAGDRWLFQHAWNSFKIVGGYLVGPKHVAWKLGALAVVAALAYLCVGSWPYKVSAPFVFEAQDKRTLAAPFDAVILSVTARPGDKVKAGQVLLELNADDLESQLKGTMYRRDSAELQRAQAKAEHKEADAQVAQADAREASAQIDLLTHDISLTKITAPIDGQVLSGTWYDKVGKTVKQGDGLFEVAPLEKMTAVIHVSEKDIDLVAAGQREGPLLGRLASRANPERKIDFRITRIVPLAAPVDGQNVFEVRADLTNPEADLLPGTEGLAHIDVGPRPIRWIISHRIMDMIHLWVWW